MSSIGIIIPLRVKLGPFKKTSRKDHLVYLLTFNKCKKQYTGQTTDNFRGIWNNYKSKSKSFTRGEKCMQEHLYKHFENKGHKSFSMMFQ